MDEKRLEYGIFSNSEPLRNRKAVLQMLDREINGTKFNSDVFKNSDWTGIPLVFAKNHPNPLMMYIDPEKAIADVQGKLVGKVTSNQFDGVGHPKMLGDLQIDDTEVNSLIDQGKLSLSTSFFANRAEDFTKIKPNHILLFIEDANNIPKDLGTMFLNKNLEPYGAVEYADPGYQADKVKRYPIDTEAHVRAAWAYINMPKNSAKYTPEQVSHIKTRIKSAAKKYGIAIGNKEDFMEYEISKESIVETLEFINKHPEVIEDEMKTLISTLIPTGIDGGQGSQLQQKQKITVTDNQKETQSTMAEDKTTELANQLAIQNKEKEALLAEKLKLEATVKAFEQKEAERIKVKQDTQWQEIKKHIPIGLTNKAEDEAKLKAEVLADPLTFMCKLFTPEYQLPPATKEDGVQYQQKGEDQKSKNGFTVGAAVMIGGE